MRWGSKNQGTKTRTLWYIEKTFCAKFIQISFPFGGCLLLLLVFFLSAKHVYNFSRVFVWHSFAFFLSTSSSNHEHFFFSSSTTFFDVQFCCLLNSGIRAFERLWIFGEWRRRFIQRKMREKWSSLLGIWDGVGDEGVWVFQMNTKWFKLISDRHLQIKEIFIFA